MRYFIYRLIAPIIRTIYRNTITSKEISGSNTRLYYNIGDHLSFFGKKKISYEPEYKKIISEFIHEGVTVFDIGANIGQYSVYFSTLVGPNGKLICIEPDSDNYAYLTFNLSKNKCRNVHLLQKAVGSESSKMVFFKDTLTGGRMSSLLRSGAGTSFKGETEEVNVVTLADLVNAYGIPHFVKLDVEGAEADVVKNVDDRLRETIFFVEVRKETKKQVYKIFSDRNRLIYLIKDGIHLINNETEIPDFANLIIK